MVSDEEDNHIIYFCKIQDLFTFRFGNLWSLSITFENRRRLRIIYCFYINIDRFCCTVPSAPADIKAVVSSRNKILVSWLPPSSPNGVLVGYTLYMSVIEDGREVC